MDAYLTGIYQTDARRMFRAWADAQPSAQPIEEYDAHEERRRGLAIAESVTSAEDRIWRAYLRDLHRYQMGVLA